MTDNLNDDVIERYVIYLASRELGVAISDNQVSEEEEKMIRLVSQELKNRSCLPYRRFIFCNIQFL